MISYVLVKGSSVNHKELSTFLYSVEKFPPSFWSMFIGQWLMLCRRAEH